MSDDLTPIEMFDATQRRLASDTDEPVRRARFAPILFPDIVSSKRKKITKVRPIGLADTHFVWLEDETLMRARVYFVPVNENYQAPVEPEVLHGTFGYSVIDEPTAVEADTIFEYQTRPVSRFVFANTEAREALYKLTESPKLRRQIEFARSLPLATVTPVLTDLLAHTWWMPHELDIESVTDWATVLYTSDGQSGTLDVLLDLVFKVLGGRDDGRLLSSLESNEAFATKSARHSRSLSGKCRAFAGAETITDFTEAVIAVDPLLANRNEISRAAGVIRVDKTLETPKGKRGTYYAATVLNRTRMKPGDDIAFSQVGDMFQKGTLVSTAAAGEEHMEVVFKTTWRKGENPGDSFIGATLQVTGMPMDIPSSGTIERWTGQSTAAEPVGERRVPEDIRLAGRAR